MGKMGNEGGENGEYVKVKKFLHYMMVENHWKGNNSCQLGERFCTQEIFPFLYENIACLNFGSRKEGRRRMQSDGVTQSV